MHVYLTDLIYQLAKNGGIPLTNINHEDRARLSPFHATIKNFLEKQTLILIIIRRILSKESYSKQGGQGNKTMIAGN